LDIGLLLLRLTVELTLVGGWHTLQAEVRNKDFSGSDPLRRLQRVRLLTSPFDTLSFRLLASNHAAVTWIRVPFRERGFRRMTISTSRSSVVRKCINRSTEKPSSR